MCQANAHEFEMDGLSSHLSLVKSAGNKQGTKKEKRRQRNAEKQKNSKDSLIRTLHLTNEERDCDLPLVLFSLLCFL